jgi:MSHA biogenesis protein MshL
MNTALAPAALVLAALATGCAELPPRPAEDWVARLRAEQAAARAAPPAAAAPAAHAAPAPAPPAPPPAAPPEPRFDLIVNNAAARDVFLSMVGDTRYSMLMHPEVAGTISVTLRGVTVREALESIRDVYGYDFRIDGRRVTVYPPTLQTRIFSVAHLAAQRRGRSEMRVGGGGVPPTSGTGAAGTTAPAAGSPTPDSTQVTTLSSSDFWAETVEALRGLVGPKGEGRAVMASPQAGTIAVRAMPDELRHVEAFLRASRIAVERQVMLEAKIVEVELREGFQSGIDWSLLRGRGSIGQPSGRPGNALVANPNGLPTLPGAVAGLLADSVALPAAGGGTFGLALATKGFQAVLGFLETHGELQILSSPRVATLNNQKAVLKVGTDEYFVTGVSGGSITPGGSGTNATTTLPTVTLTSFFSGVALDVTPQIDEHDAITLHLRPSVTSVTEKTKQIDLGTIGNYRLPLASSSVNETDTVVRVPDGQIVAIGGLMQGESTRSRSGLPGSDANPVGRALLGNRETGSRKKELVVLVRPTIIRGSDDWDRSTGAALAGFEADAPVRTVTVGPR